MCICQSEVVPSLFFCGCETAIRDNSLSFRFLVSTWFAPAVPCVARAAGGPKGRGGRGVQVGGCVGGGQARAQSYTFSSSFISYPFVQWLFYSSVANAASGAIQDDRSAEGHWEGGGMGRRRTVPSPVLLTPEMPTSCHHTAGGCRYPRRPLANHVLSNSCSATPLSAGGGHLLYFSTSRGERGDEPTAGDGIRGTDAASSPSNLSWGAIRVIPCGSRLQSLRLRHSAIPRPPRLRSCVLSQYGRE